jgi:integrase/recombinase XerD
MGTEIAPVPSGAPAPSESSALRSILRGAPPARHRGELVEWLAGRGEPTALLEVVGDWIVSRRSGSEHTRDAYAADLSRWFLWCAARGVTAGTARNTDADVFAAACREVGLAKSTTARRLAAISSWYAYAIRAGVAVANPFQGMSRPRVANVSNTRGMSKTELAALLVQARDHESARTYALLTTMYVTASRIGAILAANADDRGYDSGYEVLDLTTKGDKRKRFVLPPVAVDALGRYVGSRTTGPLFQTRTGGRVDEPAVFRLIQRVAAAAAIPQAAGLSPHSMRHTVATILLSSGRELHIVQGLLDHEDSRTTLRYDLARESLDRSPANGMAEIITAEMNRLEPTTAQQ